MSIVAEDAAGLLGDAGKKDLSNKFLRVLLYADDTLLITKNTQAMHWLLHAIERESTKYNMK